jgi:hypothetical protein
MSNAYSACVFVALGTKQVKLVRHIVICILFVSTSNIFSTLSYTSHDFRKKVIEPIMCDFLYKFCTQNFSL